MSNAPRQYGGWEATKDLLNTLEMAPGVTHPIWDLATFFREKGGVHIKPASERARTVSALVTGLSEHQPLPGPAA